MKKITALLLCLFTVFVLAACELPEDSATEPSSSAFNSSVPGDSVPGSSLPGTTPTDPASEPATAPSSMPSVTLPTEPVKPTQPSEPTTTTQPTVPPTEPTKPTQPTTPPTEPTKPTQPTTPPTQPTEPKPEPDFRKNFMNIHNAGQKYSFVLDMDSYEISLNSKTGDCTILLRQQVRDEVDFNLGPITYPAGHPLTYSRNYYYMGTYQPGADGQFQVHFNSYYMDVDLTGFSGSTIEAIRKHVWENIRKNEWQDYYLTQAECQMWDALLDGKATKDIRRWIETAELSGSASLPLHVTYFDSSGEKNRSFSLSDTQVKRTDYLYDGAYFEWAHDRNGTPQYWHAQYSDGSYSHTEHDDQGRIRYSIHTSADGSYSEQTTVWDGDIATYTTCYYAIDKIDGLYCTERYVKVTRYNPSNPSMEIPISDHKYDRNNQLVFFTIYTEKGLPLETFLADPPFRETHTLYTYENDRLVKTVATESEGIVTTTEYFYEGSRLSNLRITRQYANGDIEQWEEAPPASPASPT